MKLSASGLLVVVCAWLLWIPQVAAQDAPSTAPAPATAPATAPSAKAPTNRPSPDQEMVSISFRDAPVDQLFIFISEKTGKKGAEAIEILATALRAGRARDGTRAPSVTR